MSTLQRYFIPIDKTWITCHFCAGRGYIVGGTIFGFGTTRETCPVCLGKGFTVQQQQPPAPTTDATGEE